MSVCLRRPVNQLVLTENLKKIPRCPYDRKRYVRAVTSAVENRRMSFEGSEALFAGEIRYGNHLESVIHGMQAQIDNATSQYGMHPVVVHGLLPTKTISTVRGISRAGEPRRIDVSLAENIIDENGQKQLIPRELSDIYFIMWHEFRHAWQKDVVNGLIDACPEMISYLNYPTCPVSTCALANRVSPREYDANEYALGKVFAKQMPVTTNFIQETLRLHKRAETPEGEAAYSSWLKKIEQDKLLAKNGDVIAAIAFTHTQMTIGMGS